jgi:hypothetical protein
VSSEFDRAFAEVARRVEEALKRADARDLPVRMYVAGGAAMHFLAGGRTTEDVDAVFSRRVILGADIEVAYRDADGRARILYLDRNYNDTLGLLHEDAYADAKRVDVPGVDRKVLEVRVLAPVDLAVTKLARFADADREDIELLARRGLIESAALRRRAEEAIGGYVGDTATLRTSIDVACRLIDARRKKRR